MRDCPQCRNPLPEGASFCMRCGCQLLPEPEEPESGGQETGEIDLHGYTVAEALEVFVRCYNREIKSESPDRIKVVHGYGASGSGGVIRAELRRLLERNLDKLAYMGGETLDGNPGYTVVYPKRAIAGPSVEQLSIEPGEQLSEEILEYCAQGRSEEKIVGKFRRYGAPEIKKTLRALQNKGRMRVTWKGKHKVYESVQ